MKSSLWCLSGGSLLGFSILWGLSAYDWISAWASLELNLMVMLSILATDNNNHSLASYKYFVVQVGASIFFLAIIFAMMGFSPEVGSSPIMLGFLVMTVLVKMGGAPMHFWLIDLTAHISWLSAWYILTLQKILPFFFMTQCVGGLQELLIALSGGAGALGALKSDNFSGLVAYSSVFSVGWMLVGASTISGLFYLFTYSVALWTLFQCLTKSGMGVTHLILSKPLLGATAGVSLASMSGFPPFLGFSGKVWALTSSLEIGISLGLYFIVQLSLVMLFVYLRPMMCAFTFESKLVWGDSLYKSFSVSVWPLFLGGLLVLFLLYTGVVHSKFWSFSNLGD